MTLSPTSFEGSSFSTARDEAPQRRSERDRKPHHDRRGGSAQAGQGQFLERIVDINRVTKAVKGGLSHSFAALVVVGDGNGRVGVGHGKSREVPTAISKGVEEAKKNLFRVPLTARTIPHRAHGRATAAQVLLIPAAPGTGVIAGGPVRAVLECAGVHDVLSKSIGSSNKLNVVHAAIAALKKLEDFEGVAARRGLDPDVFRDSLRRVRRSRQ